MKTPPRIGPTADARAHVMPTRPKYFARSLMEKRSEMTMLTKMIKPPPPTPWRTRDAINMRILTETAHSRDPMRKTTLASRMTGLRPQISLSLPHRGTDAAFASRYAEPTQVYSEVVAARLPAMAGKAVVTIVISRAARNSARHKESMTTAMRALPKPSAFEGVSLGLFSNAPPSCPSSTFSEEEVEIASCTGLGGEGCTGAVDIVSATPPTAWGLFFGSDMAIRRQKGEWQEDQEWQGCNCRSRVCRDQCRDQSACETNFTLSSLQKSANKPQGCAEGHTLARKKSKTVVSQLA